MKTADKKGKSLRTFLIIIAIILAIIIPLFTAFTIYIKKNFDYNYNKITSNPEELGFEEEKDDKIINIALFGVDSDNSSFKGRSDCIIILSIDKGKKKIKLISVLRDSLVPIEKNNERVYSKINSAYASGGAQLGIKTLNQIFALDISEYVTVDFGGLIDIIDAVGGIDATITDAELTHINYTVNEQVNKYGGEASDYKLTSSGNVHLNGVQALAYSRIRNTASVWGSNNDYGRTDRQRHVLESIFNNGKQMKMSKIVNLLKVLAPCVETSLSYTDCISLASNVMFNSPSFEEARVPSTDYLMSSPKTEAGSVVYYDLNFAANLIHAFIYQDISPQEYEKIKGIQKNNWYETGYFAPVIEEVKIETSHSE